MATVEKIEEKLLSLINQKGSFAIALKGEWAKRISGRVFIKIIMINSR